MGVRRVASGEPVAPCAGYATRGVVGIVCSVEGK